MTRPPGGANLLVPVADPAPITIGTRLWTFNENRRVYHDRSTSCAPIYSEHFEEWVVMGEEKRSWVVGSLSTRDGRVGRMTTVGKANIRRAGSAFYTDDQKAAKVWLHKHRYRLLRSVEQVEDLAFFKALARAVGYDENWA